MTAQQLKNSILQMAIQGKLVPQDPNDEPASVLLKRIRDEKERMIKDGKIKREKNPSVIFRGADNLPYEKVGNNAPVCIADQVPFEIPESWEWVRLGELGELYSGYSFKSVEYQESGIQVVRISDLAGEEISSKNAVYYPNDKALEPYLIRKDSFLICLTGSIGKMAWVRDTTPRYLNQRVGMFVPNPICVIAFIWNILHTDYVLNQWTAAKTSTNGNIKNSNITALMVPLPPIEEQKRIVDALQTIEPYLQEYAEKEGALTELQSAFPEQLKKSILQQAVQGKLVPQDPNDEPASVLLERIRAEKQRLVNEGKIKKDKHESVIYRRDNSHYEKCGSEEVCIDDLIPYEIPTNWAWSRLGECLDVRDGTHDTPRYVQSGVPLVTSKNLAENHIDFSSAKFISEEDSLAINQRSQVDDGDIMFAMIGSIGNPVLYHGIGNFSIKNMALFKRIQNGLDMEYVYWFLILKQDEMKRDASGGVQSFVSLHYLRNCLIPVPPLQEQVRIRNTIEKIVPLISSL